MIEIICANPACGKIFRAYPYEVKNGRRYCSKTCVNNHIRGEKRYNWKPKVTIICACCGIEFEAWPSVADAKKYCSIACAAKVRSEQIRKSRKTVVCKGCGQEFEVAPWMKRTFCSMACYQTWRKVSASLSEADEPEGL